MTDTPITPDPEKAQHDATDESAVDAAAETTTPTPEAAPPEAAAPEAAAPEAAAPEAADADAQATVPQPTAPVAPVAPTAAQATQPTQPVPPQPYAQQHPAQQPNYGQGSFGQPAPHAYQGAPQQPYASHPQQQYATQNGVPVAGAPKTAKKRGTGAIIATLAIGALIGGIAGAGAGVGIYAATGAGSSVVKTATGPQNITVNNANDATTVTAVAATASPSVVTISVTGSSEGGTGSGIVLTDDGYILTNTHVVTLDGQASDVSITVQDNDGKIYTAKIVGTDPTTDLAVIKLDGASGLTPMKFADSSKLNVGDTAVAIGAPLGLSGTVTDGIVSALNRSISIASSAAPQGGDSSQGDSGGDSNGSPWNFDFPGQGGSGDSGSQQTQTTATISLPVIQTDAAINPGNSGGALLNSKGELIGVNVAIASASGSSTSGTQSGSIGVGFAIPANLAKRISDELIKDGAATHGLLGASVVDASSDTKATTVGAEIKEVTGGGAAAGGGLKAGDIVVGFNGLPITSATDLTAQVRALAAGAKADVTYVRGGQTKTTSVTLGSLPKS